MSQEEQRLCRVSVHGQQQHKARHAHDTQQSSMLRMHLELHRAPSHAQNNHCGCLLCHGGSLKQAHIAGDQTVQSHKGLLGDGQAGHTSPLGERCTNNGYKN